MEKTTKKAVDRVNKHREDGEETIKQMGKIIPIDAGRHGASVQVASHSKSQLEKNKSSRKRRSERQTPPDKS